MIVYNQHVISTDNYYNFEKNLKKNNVHDRHLNYQYIN